MSISQPFYAENDADAWSGSSSSSGSSDDTKYGPEDRAPDYGRSSMFSKTSVLETIFGKRYSSPSVDQHDQTHSPKGQGHSKGQGVKMSRTSSVSETPPSATALRGRRSTRMSRSTKKTILRVVIAHIALACVGLVGLSVYNYVQGEKQYDLIRSQQKQIEDLTERLAELADREHRCTNNGTIADQKPPRKTSEHGGTVVDQRLENKVNELKKKVNTNIYFTAGIHQDIKIKKAEKTVLFQHIIANVGGGYDNTTGVFTAPAAGWYLFYVAAVGLKDDDTGDDEEVRLRIHHNDVRVVRLLATHYQTTTNAVVRHMVKNDTVKVVTWGKTYLHGGGRNNVNVGYTTFTGALLSLD